MRFSHADKFPDGWPGKQMAADIRAPVAYKLFRVFAVSRRSQLVELLSGKLHRVFDLPLE
jgi:hypothetical protein